MTDLATVLGRQQGRGVLGPDPAREQQAHSRGFAAALGRTPSRAVDLGSGGGVPGLVLAVECWPEADVVLVDASQKRCTYLELCVADLDLVGRVTVRWGRAEEVGRDPAHRGAHDAVVARSFGPPAAVAECAAPLLAVGGHLVVSEPPEGPEGRWDDGALAALGLVREGSERIDGAWFTRLRQDAPCAERFPRRPGLPARRPLF
ncbi:class I SAM-dependent methyltransferase [Iamia majanohamensis]|uniref:Glucose-inhibited division protein B n=1 Tax=Iamia majanohamensis TaxID=467976 RepID=A0AAF0BTQ6_9ACTN|nr:RsmG family class I SAM-dependent methyltransferase [Iamia majanohamensis]WCO67102.1 class I SAM-dependent methyltransferase [Iamia majanohamensis]